MSSINILKCNMSVCWCVHAYMYVYVIVDTNVIYNWPL